jgi:hypothetical protein
MRVKQAKDRAGFLKFSYHEMLHKTAQEDA